MRSERPELQKVSHDEMLLAAKRGLDKVVRYMIQQRFVHPEGQYKKIIFIAALHGREQIVEMLVSETPRSRPTISYTQR